MLIIIFIVNNKNNMIIEYMITFLQIVDPDLKVLNINARYPGAWHDAFIWNAFFVRRIMGHLYNNGERRTYVIGMIYDFVCNRYFKKKKYIFIFNLFFSVFLLYLLLPLKLIFKIYIYFLVLLIWYIIWIYIGDDKYPLESWLITSLPHYPPWSRQFQYNERLCKAWNVVERFFGVFKGTWRTCLSYQRVLMHALEIAG